MIFKYNQYYTEKPLCSTPSSSILFKLRLHKSRNIAFPVIIITTLLSAIYKLITEYVHMITINYKWNFILFISKQKYCTLYCYFRFA